MEITPGYNGGTPAAVSFTTWYNRYPTAIVMRYTSSRTIPVNSAWYGQSFYVDGAGSDNTYTLASSLASTTKDYCSSLVWKCLSRGGNLQFETQPTALEGAWGVPSHIIPYDFANYGGHNGFTSVHTIKW